MGFPKLRWKRDETQELQSHNLLIRLIIEKSCETFDTFVRFEPKEENTMEQPAMVQALVKQYPFIGEAGAKVAYLRKSFTSRKHYQSETFPRSHG